MLNQRFENIEKKLLEHDQKFDVLINTHLPPNQGIFYDGQIFDAHLFVSKLIKSAKNSIDLLIVSYSISDFQNKIVLKSNKNIYI